MPPHGCGNRQNEAFIHKTLSRKFMTSYAQHYRSTLKLGVPLCIGQIGVILVGFADTLMVGHYGTNDLASVSFVNNLFNLVIIGLLGFSYGITPIIGALFARTEIRRGGSGFPQCFDCQRSVRHTADGGYGLRLLFYRPLRAARRTAAHHPSLLSRNPCVD